MDWWIIVLLVLAFVIVFGIIFYLVQFKTLDKTEQAEESKHRLELMAESLDILIEMSEDNAVFKSRLLELQDKILFSQPYLGKNAIKFDERIKNKISDLKILISRAKLRGSYISCERAVSEIELLLIERKQS